MVKLIKTLASCLKWNSKTEPIVDIIEDDSWGSIAWIQNNRVYFGDTWAPGIWAGTDGCYILASNGLRYQVLRVDLHDKSIILDHTTELKIGMDVFSSGEDNG